MIFGVENVKVLQLAAKSTQNVQLSAFFKLNLTDDSLKSKNLARNRWNEVENVDVSLYIDEISGMTSQNFRESMNCIDTTEPSRNTGWMSYDKGSVGPHLRYGLKSLATPPSIIGDVLAFVSRRSTLLKKVLDVNSDSTGISHAEARLPLSVAGRPRGRRIRHGLRTSNNARAISSQSA